MSNIYKGEFQDYEGNVVYPHTSADVVFATDGQTIQKKLNDAEIDYTDVKAQLTSGEHEFRFGVTADGEYGYHKEVEGADTVVPFKTGGELIWSKISSVLPSEGTANNFTITINKPKKSDNVLLLVVAKSSINSYSISDGIAELSLLYSNSIIYNGHLCLLSISNIQSETVTINMNKSDTAAPQRLLFQTTE